MLRDSALRKGDAVRIVLDTFHDHRNSFYFSTNPLGAQKDGYATENGRMNWDWQGPSIYRISGAGLLGARRLSAAAPPGTGAILSRRMSRGTTISAHPRRGTVGSGSGCDSRLAIGPAPVPSRFSGLPALHLPRRETRSGALRSRRSSTR